MKRTIEPNLENRSARESDAPRTLTEVAYRRIRADIVWGVLPPGSSLRSDDLRARYNVGISPLREALSRLATERMVTSIGQRGFRVATISIADVIDVTETRLILERAALTRSVEKGDVHWEANVVAAFHALSRQPIPKSQGFEAEQWASQHRAFHMALLSACGSQWQMSLAGLLFDQAERFRIVRLTKVPNQKLARDTTIEHKTIVDAVLDRNAKKAADALEQHYRATTDEVIADMRRTAGGSDD